MRWLSFPEVQEPYGIYDMRSDFFFDWLGPFFSGFYLCFYSSQVLSGELSLGTFGAHLTCLEHPTEV